MRYWTRREPTGCAHLLRTLGEGGVALQTDAAEYVRIPAVARSVYDVSGAGDTVTAVTAVSLAVGASVVEAAILARDVGTTGQRRVQPDSARYSRTAS